MTAGEYAERIYGKEFDELGEEIQFELMDRASGLASSAEPTARSEQPTARKANLAWHDMRSDQADLFEDR